MSNPTSAIQLLGGLLSMAPNAGANSPLSPGIQNAGAPSDAFYALWVGLTQSAIGDAASLDPQRQDLVSASAPNGSALPLELPPELPVGVLKRIEEVLKRDTLNAQETLDGVLDVLREAVNDSLVPRDADSKQANLSQTAIQVVPAATQKDGNAEADLQKTIQPSELSDAHLLAYLQTIMAQRIQTENDSTLKSVDEEMAELKSSITSLLAQYVEQHAAQVSRENAVSDGRRSDSVSEQVAGQRYAAEQRLNQLWNELEAARKARDSAALKNSSASEQSSVLSTSTGLDLNEQEKVSVPLIDTNETAKTNELLYQDTLNQLMTEQSRAAVTDPQTMQTVAATERPIVPPVLADSSSSQRTSEPRPAFIPTATLSGVVSSEATPAEKAALASADVMQEGNRRVLVDAMNQAALNQANTQRAVGVDDAVSERNQRQETLSMASAVTESQRMPQSPASPAQSPIAQAHNAQDALMQKMLNPAWSRALGERAVMMAQQGPRVAEVRLDPPELGSLRIRVQVHGNDQVSLIFNAPNAAVREVLEQSMPRLREMFLEQGMNLADASVSDQSPQEQSEQARSRDAGRGDNMARDEFGELPAHRNELRKLGIIDYYA